MEYERVLEQTRSWPAHLRLGLAQDLLRTLYPELPVSPAQGSNAAPRKTIADLQGILASEQPPPSDEEVRRLIEEHILEKYG
jgi:hypothetical protein